MYGANDRQASALVKVRPGQPYPLGATWDGVGVNFALSSELATRLFESADLYEHSGRRPAASINFVTAHDGFSLHDLVSYNDKHNAANLEGNQDGDNNNLSWNCGVEGATDNVEVRTLRERQKRNLLATLLLSQGVPMICGGDERDTAEALATRRLYRTGQRFQVRPRSLVVLRLVPR